jgi:hypothetical protein
MQTDLSTETGLVILTSILVDNTLEYRRPSDSGGKIKD